MCFDSTSPDYKRIRWLQQWKIPDGMKGKILDSFEELKRLIPGVKEVRKRNNEMFTRYSKKEKGLPFFIAYEDLTGCEKITLGAPKIKEDKIYCSSCDNFMGWTP